MENYIRDFIEGVEGKGSLAERLGASDRFVVFGAGTAGFHVRQYLRARGKKVVAISDNDKSKHGEEVDSISVVAPAKIAHYGFPVVIASCYAREIALQLRELGVRDFFDLSSVANGGSGCERWETHFDPEGIAVGVTALQTMYESLEDDFSRETLLSLIRYRLTMDPSGVVVAPFKDYIHPGVKPESGDTIIDAGAWIGDTALEFAEMLGGQCRTFSFEPEEANFKKLVANIEASKYSDVITPVKAGLWHERATMFIDSTASDDKQFKLSEESGEEIDLISLDDFASEHSLKIDLVKMDIEGAEYEAIAGAASIIKERSPRLQICLYHEYNDLWRIAERIRHISPVYKFYLGHHSQNLYETTLYCIRKG